MKNTIERPIITQFQTPNKYVSDMIQYLKKTQRSFSVLRSCQKLRGLSPSLVSLVSSGKRKLNYDRVNEFAVLLQLTPPEKRFLRTWVSGVEPIMSAESSSKRRKPVSSHILKDWVNLYVKDCFQLRPVQDDPELVFKILSNVATQKRIEKSIQFLLAEGHLRRTLEGRIVTETPLSDTDQQISDQKVKLFHKKALSIAQSALFTFPHTQRLANALIVPLNEEDYEELTTLIADFAENLKNFAESRTDKGTRLYQLLINLSPTGGYSE